MSPDKIRELLTAACPELTWVVDGEVVRTDGVAITARDGGEGSPMLRISNASDVRKLWREDRNAVVVAATIWSMLTGEEKRTCLGAARFVARRKVERAQARVVACTALRENAAREIETATLALQDADATLSTARADLDKAEAHAAKVGA